MWSTFFFITFLPSIFSQNVDLLIGDPWSTVEYKDCGSTAYVSEFTLTGCTTPPCSFTRGQEYTLQLSAIYQSAESATLPFTISAWKQFIFWFGSDLVKGDACEYLTVGKCPLKFGDQFGVGITVTLPTTLPSISGLVEAQLHNEQGELVLCGDLDVVLS